MRYNSYQSNEDKPQFNQAALFIERLDKLEGMVDELVANNQITLAFDLIRRVFVRILPLAKEKEINTKEIEESMKSMEEVLRNNNQSFNSIIIKTKFYDLDSKIWQLQHDLHLIMPKYQKKPWDQEVKEDFE